MLLGDDGQADDDGQGAAHMKDHGQQRQHAQQFNTDGIEQAVHHDEACARRRAWGKGWAGGRHVQRRRNAREQPPRRTRVHEPTERPALRVVGEIPLVVGGAEHAAEGLQEGAGGGSGNQPSAGQSAAADRRQRLQSPHFPTRRPSKPHTASSPHLIRATR